MNVWHKRKKLTFAAEIPTVCRAEFRTPTSTSAPTTNDCACSTVQCEPVAPAATRATGSWGCRRPHRRRTVPLRPVFPSLPPWNRAHRTRIAGYCASGRPASGSAAKWNRRLDEKRRPVVAVAVVDRTVLRCKAAPCKQSRLHRWRPPSQPSTRTIRHSKIHPQLPQPL